MSSTKETGLNQSSKEHEGFRSPYSGPILDPFEEIEITKLEKNSGLSQPFFMDSKGQFYNLHYVHISQEQIQNSNNKTKSEITNFDPYVFNPEEEKRDVKLERVNEYGYQDQIETKPFPVPQDFESFEDYEQATLDWENETLNKIGSLQLPEPIGSNIYQLTDTNLQQKTITETITETEIDESNENELDQSVEQLTTQDNQNLTEDIDINDEELESFLEDPKMILSNNDQLELLQIFEKQNPKSNKNKLTNLAIDLDSILNQKTPWDSSLIPKEPEPEFYKTFSEYERACRRWALIVSKQINSMPMHPRQLEKQALLKPHKKKLKKKKKEFIDFSRDFATWRNMMISKLSKHLPISSSMEFKQSEICSTKLLINSNQKDTWSELSTNCKENISKIFENFTNTLKLNNKLFNSNNAPIVGRYRASLQKKKKKPQNNNFSNHALFRYDLKNILNNKRYPTKNKSKKNVFHYSIPPYELSSPISWKFVAFSKKYSNYKREIDYVDYGYRFQKFYSKFLVNKYPPKKFEKPDIIQNLFIDLLINYYLNIISKRFRNLKSKNVRKLLDLIDSNIAFKSDEIGSIFLQKPEIIEEYLLTGISDRSSTISVHFLFIIHQLLTNDQELLVKFPKKEEKKQFNSRMFNKGNTTNDLNKNKKKEKNNKNKDEKTAIQETEKKDNKKQKGFYYLIDQICRSKFNHTQISSKIILEKLKSPNLISEFGSNYTNDRKIIINYLFSHPSMNQLNILENKRNNQKTFSNLNETITKQIEQYLKRREEIYDQYEENDNLQDGFQNNLITYKNILSSPPFSLKILTNYFISMYRTFTRNNNTLILNHSILLSETFYNEIITKLKINLHKHLPTINILVKFLKEMVQCLIKLQLVVGTHRPENIITPKKLPKSPRSSSKKKIQFQSSNLKRMQKSGSVGNFQSVQNMLSKSSSIYDLNINSMFLDNDENVHKKIVFKENKILQIINLLQNAPKYAMKIRKNLLKTLSLLMKERSVYLTIYSSSSFFQNLKDFCNEVEDYKFNKAAWKLFYQVILYHSETMTYLIDNDLLKNFVDILTVGSGYGLVNQLYYFEKLFRMAEIEEKRVLRNAGAFYIRYYEANPLLSYQKDTKLLCNWFTVTLQYTRFCRIHRSIVVTFSGNSFVKLARLFITFKVNKNCSKLFNEFKNSQEYFDVFEWFQQIWVNYSDNSKSSKSLLSKKRKKKPIRKKKKVVAKTLQYPKKTKKFKFK
ncbi:sca1 complex scaffold protein scaa [Anaeramoeba flamelloides]|uniref:Sca1 complex scaffold protein scaa n=1 Tax=Anaeramoeba flamelloides TaxID=1746091 RepID=A0AAV8A3B0_9EUKA|nr:sca1 complex scaffold protein scaa [Anaeramoeba flamelloides]